MQASDVGDTSAAHPVVFVIGAFRGLFAVTVQLGLLGVRCIQMEKAMEMHLQLYRPCSLLNVPVGAWNAIRNSNDLLIICHKLPKLFLVCKTAIGWLRQSSIWKNNCHVDLVFDVDIFTLSYITAQTKIQKSEDSCNGQTSWCSFMINLRIFLDYIGQRNVINVWNPIFYITEVVRFQPMPCFNYFFGIDCCFF